MSYTPSSPVVFELGGEAYAPTVPLDFHFKSKYRKPPLTLDIGCRYSRAQPACTRETLMRWLQTQPNDLQENSIYWDAATARDIARQTAWDDVPDKDLLKSLSWSTAIVYDATSTVLPWYQVPEKDASQRIRWDHSIQQRDTRLRLIYNPQPAQKDSHSNVSWGRVNEHGPRFDAPAELRRSLYIPNTLPLLISFGSKGYNPKNSGPVFYEFQYVRAWHAIQPVDSTATRIRWGNAKQINTNLRLRWGWGIPTDPRPTGIIYPDYDGPITPGIDDPLEPEIEETYVIANTVSVCVLPDCTPIDVTNIGIDLDIDSYSWRFTGSLFGSTSLQQVVPNEQGQKTIKVAINGHEWLFLVQSYSSSGKFPTERFTIHGVSRTQLLAEPYAPKRSAVNAVDINARQAAEDQLLNTGFTMRWDSLNQGPVDWSITAGALTYQDQTPMQIISRISESIGAIVRPAAAADEFSVLPRYRAAVWNWHSTIVDCIVPHQIVTDIGGEWSPQPAWNSCYISGTTQGVAVDVRRAGTAGDKPAPDVYDELITTTDAARARGIAEICKGGNQEVVSMTMPLFPPEKAPGLVLPAQLCEVRPHNQANWRGLCLATSISASGTGASTVKQTIRLERHHGNS